MKNKKTLTRAIVGLVLMLGNVVCSAQPLVIPKGVSLLGTNQNFVFTSPVTLTNMSTNTVFLRGWNTTSVESVFRLYAPATLDTNGNVTAPARYRAFKAADVFVVRFGPFGGTNYIKQIPAGMVIPSGLLVQSDGEIDTDYTPTNAVPGLGILP